MSVTLIIDTGSSNTWVGATKAFTPTSSTQETIDLVEVTYGSGFFVGHFGKHITNIVYLHPDSLSLYSHAFSRAALLAPHSD